MKQATLVVGPEASGTRYLAYLLSTGGAVTHYLPGQCEGWASHAEGDWELILPSGPHPNNIIVARSFPFAGQWPSIPVLIGKLVKSRYTVRVLVVVRHPRIVELSQVRAGHVLNMEEARANIARAYTLIFSGLRLACADFAVVPYQSLALAGARVWLQEVCRLPTAPAAPWKDGDAKYSFHDEFS